MFILANLVSALAVILNMLINVMIVLIFVRALISWVNADPYNPIVQFLHKTTEPVLEPIRRILPFNLKMGIDISPIAAFIILLFMRLFIINTLFDLSIRMKTW